MSEGKATILLFRGKEKLTIEIAPIEKIYDESESIFVTLILYRK